MENKFQWLMAMIVTIYISNVHNVNLIDQSGKSIIVIVHDYKVIECYPTVARPLKINDHLHNYHK